MYPHSIKMASPSGGEVDKLHEIDLMSLTFQQLNQLKNQMDQACSLFQDSLETLKITQTKLRDSGECLKKMTPENKGATVLIPLSSSMYVPGRIADTDHVIVDVGTGYYVKKNVEDGKDYFQRKVNYLTEQIEKIQVLAIEKTRIRDTIIEVIEIKANNANAAKNAVKA